MKIQYLASNAKKGFSFLAGINRPVVPNQVTKLSESIKRMGIIRPVVVTDISFISGSKTRYIIDGQHLYTACMKLSVDVPFIIIQSQNKVELIEQIALLNSSSKSWTMVDYVTAWSNIVPDYIKLMEYYKQHDLELSVLASILSGSVGSTGMSINQKIKKGTFKIVNEKTNAVLLNYIDDVLSIVPRMSRYENKYLCNEYLRFVKNSPRYNHDSFISKLAKNKKQFILATQEEGKLNELFEQLSKQ